MIIKTSLEGGLSRHDVLAIASAIRLLRGVTAVEIQENPLSVTVEDNQPAPPTIDMEDHFNRSLEQQINPKE